MRCLLCGCQVIYLRMDGSLLPVEVDRIHTLNMKDFSIVAMDGTTVTISDVHHWRNCKGEQ